MGLISDSYPGLLAPALLSDIRTRWILHSIKSQSEFYEETFIGGRGAEGCLTFILATSDSAGEKCPRRRSREDVGMRVGSRSLVRPTPGQAQKFGETFDLGWTRWHSPFSNLRWLLFTASLFVYEPRLPEVSPIGWQRLKALTDGSAILKAVRSPCPRVVNSCCANVAHQLRSLISGSAFGCN